MDIKQLLEKMDQFAGQAVGQKPGDQWRGSDKLPPGKKLVGDSILKDLSKGKTPKSKEQELSEEFQAFLEAEFKDTVDKRPARKNARPARGHEPKSGYKTVKADESAMSDKDIELQDYRSMSHKEFQTAYGMTKTEWINQNKALVIKRPDLKKSLGLDEGWESGPEEYKEPYDDADDAYDRRRQEKIDAEAEKAQAKRPQTKIYSLLGRGPNMEPNYKFPGEYNSLDAAVAARKKIMADPKTPYPQHIGISSRTKYLDENSVTPLRDREDYQAKSKTLQDIQMDPDTHKDPQLSSELARRKDILMKQAQALGIDESRAHKVLNTWFKDRERQEKFAKGELTVPTPQERNTKIEKPKKEVKEYGASMSGATGTGSVATSTTAATPPGPGNPNDPEAVKKAAAALTQIKSATNSPAPPAVIAKALDAADQGKQVGSADMKALKPMMDVIKQAAQDPKLAAQFKTLSQQARQAQQK